MAKVTSFRGEVHSQILTSPTSIVTIRPTEVMGIRHPTARRSYPGQKQFKRSWREDRKSRCISTKVGKSAGIVSRYKKVGRIWSRTQNPRHDTEAKANSALMSYHQLAHSVFRN